VTVVVAKDSKGLFQKVPAHFVCGVLLSGNPLELVSILHCILIVRPSLQLITSLSERELLSGGHVSALSICTKEEQKIFVGRGC
jgi:hypothetical protein